jgi:transposase-like protein
VRLALRARIVVLAAQGLQNIEIAARLGVGRVQVSRWRERYIESRLAGIERDLPRGAPPTTVDVARLVELTTQSTPEAGTHWSTRTLAALTPNSAAIVRVLQCVAASGVLCVVSSTRRATSTVLGGAPRGRSRSMPASLDSI